MRKTSIIFLILIASFSLGCMQAETHGRASVLNGGESAVGDSTKALKAYAQPDTPTEAQMRAMGLVDVQELDSTILVSLVYATPDNFMGEVLYQDIHKAFLLPQMAEKVVAAQRELRSEHPELTLLIWDAARPLSVQKKMFRRVVGTPQQKYVANPNNGPGMHNFGAAVDITLADTLGQPLPMGTPFDHFGKEANTNREKQLLDEGKITRQEYDNRLLLRRLLKKQGLRTISSEWWHFNLMDTQEGRRKLKAIEN